MPHASTTVRPHWPVERALQHLRAIVPQGSVPHAAEIAACLRHLNAKELFALNLRARKALAPQSPDAVRPMTERVPPTVAWVVAAVLSFHKDGFVRERAVAQLSTYEPRDVLGFLLLRLNDWVGPIRERARAAISDMLKPRHARAFVDMLQMLELARSWGRGDHTAILEQIGQLVQAPNTRRARWEALAHPDARQRRLAFALCLRADNDLAGLADAAEEHGGDWQRRQVLRVASGRDDAVAQRIAVASLLETTATLRALAQGAVRRQQPDFDLRAYYTRALAGPSMRGALYGLAETGTAADGPAAVEALEHPHTSVRRAALYAIAWLDSEGLSQHTVRALTDSRARVRADACRWLCRYPHLVAKHRAEIERVAGEARDGSSRGGAAEVLAVADAFVERWM